MNAPTAAIPLAMYMSQLAAQVGATETASLKYVVYDPSRSSRDATTETTTSIEGFRLTSEELAKFHELNINPPSVDTEVIDIFRSKLAQD